MTYDTFNLDWIACKTLYKKISIVLIQNTDFKKCIYGSRVLIHMLMKWTTFKYEHDIGSETESLRSWIHFVT